MFKKIFLFFSFFILASGLITLYPAEAINSEDIQINYKIGQMMCLDFRFWSSKSNNKSDEEPTQIVTEHKQEESRIPVTEINDEIKEIISKYHIGGVILFSQNFQNKNQAKKLISDLQKAAKDSGNPPLFICVDQEGGRVERFTFGRDKLKNNLEIGKMKNSEKLAFEKGKIIGRELSELGINCNFAPVVDVNSNPENPVINVRSFGETAEIVSKCGVNFMKGLHSQNIIATAKHFPGHGDTDVDSHISLPRVNKTMAALENLELKPFKAMIDSGVDMVMTAHIELPKIEKTAIISKKDGREIFLPATLSKTILTELLRNKLNFKGVIITDAMNMKAISENVGEAEATKMAISAGADMICMPAVLRSKSDITKLDNIFETLKRAINNEISMKQIDNSAERISNLKKKFYT